MKETEDLRQFLAPLLEFHGAGFVDEYIGITKQARNKWYTQGLPVSELLSPKRIAKIAALAQKHKGTSHITVQKLKRYIGNAKGE